MPIRWIRKEILIRKYWQGLIKLMKEQNTPGENSQAPGIAFSFDDSFRIHDWYMYGKDLLGFYDVKVTFNMNAFHHFEGQREHTQAEIDKLIELQANGHELAHHGFAHQESVNYSNQVGVENWLKNEIQPLFDWIEKQKHSRTGERMKRPVTFAYPYTAYNDVNNSVLVPDYFKIVRGGPDLYKLPKVGHSGYAPSICIDRNHLFKLKYLKKAMKITKQTGANLIIMCHSILPDDVNWEEFGWGEESRVPGEYRTSPRRLQAIISEARKLELKFYTTAEIAGVATFIDRHFECYVREKVLNTTDKWIMINDLHAIKTLDLSDVNVTNLDGIQYFINLEKLNLGNHNIKDLRLLERLPRLKVVGMPSRLNKEPISENYREYRLPAK